MHIAFVEAQGRGATDSLLVAVAELLGSRGIRLCGAVQHNVANSEHEVCDMDLALLPAGPKLRISQRLGSGARGCRLDPDGLERAVALCAQGLSAGQVLIVNKFGKHEAEGRGFVPVIADALALGMPVLLGVSASQRGAFEEFSGGLAEALPPDTEAIAGWCRDRLAPV